MSNLCGSRSFRADSVNEIQVKLFRELLANSCTVSPRGLPTQELMFVGIELTNPRRRMTTLSARRWSPKLAIGELCWNLRGERSVDQLAFYAPRWLEFADSDRVIRGSCYGNKIFKRKNGNPSQWDNISDILRSDPDSRRAVLSFHGDDFSSRAIHSGDVACITSMQFFIRNGRLDAIVSMRSNDVYWGLPYDIFIMTSLQEMMAETLEIELGSYFHQCGSLHFYSDKREKISRILREPWGPSPEMKPMQGLKGRERLIACEKNFRRGSKLIEQIPSSDFWSECCNALFEHQAHVIKNGAE
ncbi:thymidylate synthase [Erythrobacter sp. 3-20A1M]|uniref:thymidylate synthase n=1 Tax=Erythrobacter sp. 3-20A1M TaxID=2653850 RepID=UPI001BFC2C5B|nr:thymidylate synthase [Erythrobacter sp. 3-20A1M]